SRHACAGFHRRDCSIGIGRGCNWVLPSQGGERAFAAGRRISASEFERSASLRPRAAAASFTTKQFLGGVKRNRQEHNSRNNASYPIRTSRKTARTPASLAGKSAA